MGRKPRHARLKRGGPAVAFAITSGYQSWLHWDLVSILWPPLGALIFVLPATGRSRSSQPFPRIRLSSDDRRRISLLLLGTAVRAASSSRKFCGISKDSLPAWILVLRIALHTVCSSIRHVHPSLRTRKNDHSLIGQNNSCPRCEITANSRYERHGKSKLANSSPLWQHFRSDPALVFLTTIGSARYRAFWPIWLRRCCIGNG